MNKLKDLTHMFVFESHVTNYIKRFVLLCFHIKIDVPFWAELKKASPKSKT
jgi:hypothetical protein